MKVLRFGLALALVLCLVPFALLQTPQKAYAATNVAYLDQTGTLQTVASATDISSSTTAISNGWYVVSSTVSNSNTITVTGDVNLILMDGFTLTASKGIAVASGNSLTIYGQTAGSGRITATGAANNAGIGGANGNAGTITINGGTINATGGDMGAGIGGGSGGSGGTITINGGNVTAAGANVTGLLGLSGSYHGAGIGGGGDGTGGNITITGGTVNAIGGGYGGAGIGGGAVYAGSGGTANSGGNITISGGTVTATGNTCLNGGGAGIGGGGAYSTTTRGGDSGNISISGTANVTATGGSGNSSQGGGGAAIGSGGSAYSSTGTSSGYTIYVETTGTLSLTSGTGQGSGYLNGAKVGAGGYKGSTAVTEMLPTAPQSLAATAGNAQVTLNWAMPVSTGDPLTGFIVQYSSNAGTSWTSVGNVGVTVTASTTNSSSPTTQSYTVTGLTNGTTYSFEVCATNVAGSGPYAQILNAATPQASPPSVPQNLAATPGNGQVTLTFNPPANTGGTGVTITDYTATANPGGAAASGTASPLVVSGLTNGTSYTFSLTATSSASLTSTAVTVTATPYTTPAAPPGLSATPGNGEVALSWGAVDNGGSAITGYEYSTDGGATWLAIPSSASLTAYTVTTLSSDGTSPLVDGTGYTFMVRADNAAGSGAAASVAATPLTVPGTPQNVTATGGNAKVTVTFSAPSSDGGSPITSYTVTVSPAGTDGATFSGTSSPITVTGLTNGTAYSFTVAATNAAGTGAASGGISATPVAIPGPPTALSATPSDNTIMLVWSAPSDNGGSAITGYEVSTDGGSNWASVGMVSSYSVTGLSNGTAYTFMIRADNIVGAGTAASITATPGTVPSSPTITAANAGDGQVTLNWSTPANGGSPITGYQYSTDGGNSWQTVTGGASPNLPYDITGLTNGTAYNFVVRALNNFGNGASSAVVSATPLTKPDVPQNVAATAGNGQATVTFNAPSSDGGSAITTYTVTASPGGATETGSSSPITVTGLTNGTLYTFTVTATNAAGDGSPSTASAAVTPYTVAGAPTITNAIPGNNQVNLLWSAPSDTGGSAITGYDYSTDGGTTWLPVSGGANPTMPYAVTGLTNGTTYTLAVRADNAAGAGAQATVTAIPITTPSAPQNVAATAGNAKITFTWAAPASDGGSTTTGYQVSTDGGTNWQPTSPLSASTLSYAVTGLTNGNNYNCVVRAINAAGDGADSSSISVKPYNIPDAPTNVSATADNGKAEVSFTTPADNGSDITSYTITSNPGGTPVTVNAPFVQPVTISGLTNGVSYSFTVVATNAAGNSDASLASAAVIPCTNPDAPGNLSATPSNNAITLAWSAPDSDGGSAIIKYQYSTDGSTWTDISGSSASTTTYTINGLTNGTTYTYQVRAVNGASQNAGQSAASNSATATPCTAPDAPTNLAAATGGGDGQVALTWTAPGSDGGSVITDYQISTDGGSTWINTNSTAPSFTVGGLTNGTSYDFCVRAVNATSSGASSPTVTATPTPAPSAPAITTTTLPDAVTNSPYNQTLAATGYPTPSWAVTSGALPPGLSLDPATGAITGTPTERGTYSFTVTASNGNAPDAAQTLTLTVGVPTEPAYQVVYDFGVWSGSGTATAYITADYDKFFQLVYPDLTPVPTAYYTIASGSTYIILTEAYLQTLPDGLYYYIAEYIDGDTRLIWLQIDRNGTSGNGSGSGDIPATGDTPWLPLSATVCLLVGVVCLAAGKRTRRNF